MVIVLLAVSVFNEPGAAAWVWVYGGEKHVLLPPEEGEPPWARFPDSNGDGKPDPVITEVHLRIEDTEGRAINRTRLGRTIRLVATPELGGLELEPLSVTFRLSGPAGDAKLVPDRALQEATVLGTAPAIYVATYTLPEPPSLEFVGEWQASVQVKVGETVFDTAARHRVTLVVLGPRETTVEKIGRTVRGGLELARSEVKELGEKVASVEAWLQKQRKEPPPGALKPVQPRQTLGMADKALRAPNSPLTGDAALLGVRRATALRSRSGPPRSVLVMPLDKPAAPRPDGRLLVGYAVLEGLIAVGTADSQPVASWACEGCIHALRLVLETEPGAADGNIHLETPEGTLLATIPTTVERFRRVLWPGQTELHVQRTTGGEAQATVCVTMISAVSTGAVRVRFLLPLVPLTEPPTPVPTAEGSANHSEPP